MPFGARRLFLFWLARPTMGDDIPQMRYFARLQIQGNKIASCTFVRTKQYKQVVFLWPQR